MAKSSNKSSSKTDSEKSGSGGGTALARTGSSKGDGSRTAGKEGVTDALTKLLQSPLVADLMAVAATAALAALAEHGFSAGDTGRGKRAGKAVKEAGKAAAAAIGRRLANEFDEIRGAAKAKSSAAA